MKRAVHATTVALLLSLLPAGAQAQEAQAPLPSHLWLTVGVVSGTIRGDCQECERDFPYHHSVGVVGNIGYRVNPRMHVGFDMFYMPFDSTTGRIRGAHLDAVAQFRPWSSKGFFVKGGAGMAFIQNWAETTSLAPINSKALSILVGGGWAFRRESRVGVSLFAEQHVAALGDLQLGPTSIADVTGNSWAIGAALVIR